MTRDQIESNILVNFGKIFGTVASLSVECRDDETIRVTVNNNLTYTADIHSDDNGTLYFYRDLHPSGPYIAIPYLTTSPL